MHLFSLLLSLSLGVLVYAGGSDWCYSDCNYTPTYWGDLPHSSCDEKRQSPIDIDTSHVKTDQGLLKFNFVNFNSNHVIKSITNNGHTVKCILEKNAVNVSGGGLDGTYSTIQFHFHWGDTAHHPGSEHTINGHRYPMEMHIVSLKENLTVEEATEQSEGIAVLGFFINATEDGNKSLPWHTLTSYLTNITDVGSEVNVIHNISISDLIGDVNLTKFYRYLGSLTTPNCSEAVVWTVFQEPININKDMVLFSAHISVLTPKIATFYLCWKGNISKTINLFPRETGLLNVYRPTQDLNGREVLASPGTLPSHAWCYHDHCDYNSSFWHLLPHSHCDGEHQSPINIDTEAAVVDKHLDAFRFTKFDDKHAFKYIINTGHSVKCVLKEDMVEVSGGGLGHVYSTLQFHFHWGSESQNSKGSEHMVDSHRYPMEMHIVNKRKDLSLEEALQARNGLAVLGFFIEPTDNTKSSSSSSDDGGSDHHEAHASSDMAAWKNLTNYLSFIQNINSKVNVTHEISIDDLLSSVDRESYYRYSGSLTTPSCNEAVVWTVFKETIKVDQSLMTMFPAKAGYHDVFRPVQPLHSRTVYTTSVSSTPAPIILFLLLACLCALSHNLQL